MSSLQTHPEDGLLLRYLDGELPRAQVPPGARPPGGLLAMPHRGRGSAKARSRSACIIARTCCRRICRLRRRLGPILSTGFAGIDSAVGAESWMARLGRCSPRRPRDAGRSRLRRRCCWPPALYYQFRETPSVQAAALLKRAVAVAATAPASRAAGPDPHQHRRIGRLFPAMLRAAHYNSETSAEREVVPGMARRARVEARRGRDGSRSRVAGGELLPHPHDRRGRRPGDRRA